MTDRSDLRRSFRKRRRALSDEARSVNADSITRHFFATGLALRARRIGAYLSRPDGEDGEVDLRLLLERLFNMGKQIALPVIRRRGSMEFYEYDPDQSLLDNRFHIPEPPLDAPHVKRISQNLILAPLVAFDEAGVRLGMGGGYYDRYLGSICPTLRPLIIGIAHETQRSGAPLPFDAWDVRLDGVITEAGWQTFG
ncbi:MAG: 5-formyltetrahydrofolate cyclo-ligase [Gammaproteobacteria bacterium]|nr:5-formyltetrahydrofolate cyclo-ligase [Gammaproteobacteria bacterium]